MSSLPIKAVAIAGGVAAVLATTAGVAAAAPAAQHGRSSVTIHITSNRTVGAPKTTRPGVVDLRDTGRDPVFVVTPRHGAGRARLARDLNAAGPGGLIRDFTVADLLGAHNHAYLRLAHGSYYLADANREKFTATSISTMHVTGRTENVRVPAASQVTVTRHDTLGAAKRVPASSYLRVVNGSAHLQEVWLAPVGKKVSAAALKAFLAKPSLDGLFTVDPTISLKLIGMLSPGHRVSSHYASGAGRHLLVTFTFTTHTTVPTLKRGQARLVTVR